MRLGTVALIVALALAAPTPAPAQVPSGPLSIHVEAVLGEPTTVGVSMVFPLNGTAILSQLIVGESGVSGDIRLPFPTPLASDEQLLKLVPVKFSLELPRGPLIEPAKVVCTGMVDDAGNGSGRCASSGDFPGEGAWSGQIDFQAPRFLTLTMFLHVVCPRCASR